LSVYKKHFPFCNLQNRLLCFCNCNCRKTVPNGLTKTITKKFEVFVIVIVHRLATD
jgi:hypothetical protein